MDFYMIEPEMIVEDLEICFETGRCPRCAAILDERFDGEEFEFRCPGCQLVIGGFW
jgi:uncharacterized C2H2 Zn-finger protein